MPYIKFYMLPQCRETTPLIFNCVLSLTPRINVALLYCWCFDVDSCGVSGQLQILCTWIVLWRRNHFNYSDIYKVFMGLYGGASQLCIRQWNYEYMILNNQTHWHLYVFFLNFCSIFYQAIQKASKIRNV